MPSCRPLLKDIKNYSPLSVHIELKVRMYFANDIIVVNVCI